MISSMTCYGEVFQMGEAKKKKKKNSIKEDVTLSTLGDSALNTKLEIDIELFAILT